MPAATTLAARLLYASRYAYSIKIAGSLPTGGDAASAGFGNAIAAITSGRDAIDACCVTRSDDGLVVAFRGTLPPDSPNHRQTAQDWVNDLEAALVKWAAVPQGEVHQGFLASLEGLWPGLQAAVASELAGNAAWPILVTGHSKGGALAQLGALQIAQAFDLAPDAVVACTFAAPHAGDAGFAAALSQSVRSITRYEYADDMVPHVPLSLAMRHAFADVPLFANLSQAFDYAAAGELRFIDWDGHVVGDSPTLRAERTFHLIRLICAMGFDRIVLDHTLEDGSGYFNGIVGNQAPSGVTAATPA